LFHLRRNERKDVYDEGEDNMYTRMYNEGEFRFHGTTMYWVGVGSGAVGAILFEFFLMWLANWV